MKKRLLAILLSVVMVVGMFPVSVLAEGTTTFSDKDEATAATGVTAGKVVTDNGDGTYTITLSVIGTTEDASYSAYPADVILVVDTSTSMNDPVTYRTCGGTYVERSFMGGTFWECDSCGHRRYSNPNGAACTQTVVDSTRLDVAKLAAASFVSGLLGNEGVQVGLYDFSGSNRTSIALTNNAETLAAAVQNLNTPGFGDGTHYDLGLSGAAELLEDSADGREKVVVFLSDGEPTRGHEGVAQATALQNSGVTIFTVGIDIGGSTTAQAALQNISSSDDNGNKYYYPASSDGSSGDALSAVLSEIQTLIENLIHAGTNAVMTDVVNTEYFELVGTPEGLEMNESGDTLTWDIGDITSEEKTITFTIQVKEGVTLEPGTYFTNENVSISFDSSVMDETVTILEPAVGNPSIEILDVVVTANSATVTYNGSLQSVSGYSATAGYTVTGLTAEGSGKNAAEYAVNFSGTPVVYDAAGNDISYKCAVSLVPGKLTINPRSVTLSSGSASKEYDGEPLTNDSVTVTGDGWAEGEGASYDVTGSQTVVGTSPNTFTYSLNEGTLASNYNITVQNGILTVVDRTELFAVTVTGETKQVSYSGSEQSISSYSIEGLADGFSLSGISYSAAGTNAGSYSGAFTGTPVIKDSAGNDVSAQFAVSLVPGKLQIDPLQISITAASASKMYDGSPLTDNGYSISSGSLADGDSLASVAVNGSQTDVGSSANVPSAARINDETGADVTANYTITYINGTLTVVADENASIEIVAYSGIYDGAAHDALTSVILKNGSGEVISTSGWTITYNEAANMPKITDVGSLSVTVYATNPNYNSVTAAATATVSPRPVTLTSATATKVYDGSELKAESVSVSGSGFVSGEGVNYFDFASILDLGSTANSFKYAANEGTKLTNYDITVEYGTLTITPITTQIIITAASDSKTYDGDPLTNDGYSFTEDVLVKGDELVAVVEGSVTDVGTAANKVTSYKVMRGGTDVTENYSFGASVDGLLSVTKRSVTLTSPNATKEYDGTALSATNVTAEGFVTGEGVSFSDHASITNVGQISNSFTYAANAGTKLTNYDITVVEGVLKIDKSDNAVLTVNGYTGKYDGAAHSVNHSITGAVEGTEWSWRYKVGEGDYSSEMPSFVNVGEYTVTVEATNPNYVTLTGSAIVKILPREVTLTSASASRPYNGSILRAESVTVSGDGFVEGEGASYSNFASIIDYGSVDNSFTYSLNAGTLESNYNITVRYGKLEITAYTENLVITAASASKTYDGSALVDPGYSVNTEKLIAGDVLTAVVEGSITNVGTVANKVTSYRIMRGETDVTENYSNVELVDGSLTVNAKNVTMTSASDTKAYDGTPLTNSSVTAVGFVNEEGASYSVTGSQTFVGTSENKFDYTLNEGTLADNYTIEKVYGSLVVTENTDVITIIAASSSKTYDGSPLTDSGYTITGELVEGDELSAVVEGSITNVGSTANKVASYRIMRGETDVTENYSGVVTQDGSLSVTKRSVTLTSGTAGKVYDGEPLTDDSVTVTGDGWAEGEGASYDVTGSQTVAGTSPNTFTYSLNEGTLESNYNITVQYGTLTVSAVEGVVVTITENSGVFAYDGSEKSVSGYSVDISNTLYTEADFSFSGTASVSGTEPGVYDMALTAAMFENNNESFANVTFVIVDGTLTIDPVVTVETYLEDTEGEPIGEPVRFRVPYKGSWKVVIGTEDESADYIAPESITFDDDCYVITDNSTRSGDALTENHTVKLVYTLDNWSDEEDDDNTPDGIPDNEQVKIIYKPNDEEKGSVTKTMEIETIVDGVVSPEGSTAEADTEGYAFDQWTDEEDAYLSMSAEFIPEIEEPVGLGVYTYIAVFDRDTNRDTEGDGICDKYQIFVDYNVNNSSYGSVSPTTEVIDLARSEEDGSANTTNVAIGGSTAVLTDSFRAYFANWTHNGSEVSKDKALAYIFASVTGGASYTFTANFAVIPAEPALNLEDHVAYIIGYGDGTVRPEKNISRAEVATIFFRLLTEESRETFWSRSNSYTDIKGDEWFNNAVSTLSKAGVITGYPDGSFRPNAPITRAEFAAIAARFSKVVYSESHSFTDVPLAHWASAYIALAEHLGYIDGYEDGSFRPDRSITRAESVTLLNRVLERAVEEEQMIAGMVSFSDCKPGAWYYEAIQEAANSHEYTRLGKPVSGRSYSYEDWTKLLPNPDWAALEQAWSKAKEK